MNNKDIPIGKLILQQLKANKRSVAWLADEILVDSSNFRKKLKKQSMDSELLHRISKVLHCNFFLYYEIDKEAFD